MSGMFGYRAALTRASRQQADAAEIDLLLSRLQFDIEIGAIANNSTEIDLLLSQLQFDIEVEPVVSSAEIELLLSSLEFNIQITAPVVEEPVAGWLARWEADTGYSVDDPVPGTVRWYALDAAGAPVLSQYLEQTNPTLVPSYNGTGINGEPAIYFTGQRHVNASLASANIKTTFVVFKPDGNFVDFDGVVEWLSNTAGGFAGRPSTPNVWTNTAATLDLFQIDGVNQNLTNARDFNTGVSLGVVTNPHVIAIRNTADTTGLKEVWAGRSSFSPTRAYSGMIAAIYLYSSALSDTDVATQTAYLRGKYGF